MNATRRRIPSSHRLQRGVGTLLVTIVMLVILTVIVLSSSNVALFEQKTATNENRQRLADQAAEYALNLGVEFFKANVVKIASEQTLGWLPAGTAPHWQPCLGIISPATHPCMAEPVGDIITGTTGRRAQLYYYTFGGSTNVDYNGLVVAGGQLGNVGGNVFSTTGTVVNALLCRLDTAYYISGVLQPTQCRATPSTDSSNRIAVTVVAKSTLPGENSVSEMKVTLGNFDTFSIGAAVPLVASGSVDGTGNVEIVTASNGGGTGIPVSIWSSSDADIDKTGGGSAASVSTCQVGEFLKATPEAQLLTTCATVNNACGCPSMSNGATKEIVYAKNPNMLSGHVPGAANCCENIDILDVDSNKGTSPDITFYPAKGMDNVVGGAPAGATAAEIATFDASAISDDSLFEWVFGVSGESVSTLAGGTGKTLLTCAVTADNPTGNCAIYYLTTDSELNAQEVTCTQLNALGASATGLYYVTDSSAASACSLPNQVGTPDAPALVVVNDDAAINNTLLYGLLFVRSTEKGITIPETNGACAATARACLRGNGQAQVYGSIVVEGKTRITGGLRVVYSNVNISKPGGDLPETTRFGMVPGSWLDNSRAGF